MILEYPSLVEARTALIDARMAYFVSNEEELALQNTADASERYGIVLDDALRNTAEEQRKKILIDETTERMNSLDPFDRPNELVTYMRFGLGVVGTYIANRVITVESSAVADIVGGSIFGLTHYRTVGKIPLRAVSEAMRAIRDEVINGSGERTIERQLAAEDSILPKIRRLQGDVKQTRKNMSFGWGVGAVIMQSLLL